MLIDVRTKEEFEESHAEGAINLPLDQLEFGGLGQLEHLPKDTPLKLYCRSGARSEMAKYILMTQGFSQVENLGGLKEVNLQ